MAKACGCGTCPACKAAKNPNMKRKQSLTVRNKHSMTKAKGKK
jgi:hypothetical protein